MVGYLDPLPDFVTFSQVSVAIMIIKIGLPKTFRYITLRRPLRPLASRASSTASQAGSVPLGGSANDMSSSSLSQQDGNQIDESYFKFTRARFVINEQYEMSQRYVRYNIHELGRIAANAVGAKSCISIEKFPDGLFNKVLLLKLDNGTQVTAKIPYPAAVRPHFTTASEVATMEFVCSTLFSLQLAVAQK